MKWIKFILNGFSNCNHDYKIVEYGYTNCIEQCAKCSKTRTFY